MKQWLKIRWELYLQIRHRVDLLLGPSSKIFSSYTKAYEASFKKTWKPSKKSQLIGAFKKSRLICLGDFHAIQQSQRSHLRLLEALPFQPDFLAVEFLEAQHQPHIDAFQAGKISEKEFLRKVSWDERWSFSWSSYRMLVDWAQKKKVRLIGLNHLVHQKSAASLRKRDRLAAKVVAEEYKKNPKARAVIIFGELHLGEKHLPLQLNQKVKNLKASELVVVFQSPEQVFFKVMNRYQDTRVDVVRAGVNRFCLLNIAPWVKWQNYLLELEERMDPQFEEDGHDLTDEIAKYIGVLDRDLQTHTKKDQFSVYSADDDGFWNDLSKSLPRKELTYFRGLIENGISFYLAQKQMAFMAEPSVNHSAVLAMAIVHAQLSKLVRYPADLPHDFLKLIWLEAVLYFGSKLINPNRKTDMVGDLKAQVNSPSLVSLKRDSLKIALQQKMQEFLYLSQGRKLRTHFSGQRSLVMREAARSLGGMMGEKLYHAYQKKLFSNMTLLSLLSKKFEEPFQPVYLEILQTLELFPEPFLSKSEKL